MKTTYRETAYTNGYEFTQGSGYELPEYPFVEPPELKSGKAQRHPVVAAGRFGAEMQVSLVNDGPVTVPMQIR